MKIVPCKFFPPSYLINLFGVLFARERGLQMRYAQFLYLDPYTTEGYMKSKEAWKKLNKTQEVLRMIIGRETLNEERIHTEQMKWLLFIQFYVLYFIFFLVYLLKTFSFTKAYNGIPFEREARINREDFDYCQTREKYGWLNYL